MIEDQLARQVGKSVFSLVDLEDGFHQMHLEPSCCHLAAFITPFGVYEWLVLPMGVKVGPQVFTAPSAVGFAYMSTQWTIH